MELFVLECGSSLLEVQRADTVIWICVGFIITFESVNCVSYWLLELRWFVHLPNQHNWLLSPLKNRVFIVAWAGYLSCWRRSKEEVVEVHCGAVGMLPGVWYLIDLGPGWNEGQRFLRPQVPPKRQCHSAAAGKRERQSWGQRWRVCSFASPDTWGTRPSRFLRHPPTWAEIWIQTSSPSWKPCTPKQGGQQWGRSSSVSDAKESILLIPLPHSKKTSKQKKCTRLVTMCRGKDL